MLVLRIVYAGTDDPAAVPAWYSSAPAIMSAGQAIVDDAFALVTTGHPSVILETDMPDSPPARALIRASGTADLMVVGARGQGGFKELLLGSVTQRTVHGAICPVVVVRPSRTRTTTPPASSGSWSESTAPSGPTGPFVGHCGKPSCARRRWKRSSRV